MDVNIAFFLLKKCKILCNVGAIFKMPDMPYCAIFKNALKFGDYSNSKKTFCLNTSLDLAQLAINLHPNLSTLSYGK